MGYMRYHAIVVSSWNDTLLHEARAEAVRIFAVLNAEFGSAPAQPPSLIMPSSTNGIGTFLVPPDGSKEGWPESDAGNKRRDEFVAWLNSKVYDDGSTSLRWVEVQYGDGNGIVQVCRSDDLKATDDRDADKAVEGTNGAC